MIPQLANRLPEDGWVRDDKAVEGHRAWRCHEILRAFRADNDAKLPQMFCRPDGQQNIALVKHGITVGPADFLLAEIFDPGNDHAQHVPSREFRAA